MKNKISINLSNLFIYFRRLSEKIPYSDFISPVCLPTTSSTNAAASILNHRNEDSASAMTFNEIVSPTVSSSTTSTTANYSSNLSNRILFSRPSLSRSNGIVVGWGSIERHGDVGASREFIQQMNRMKNISGSERWKLNLDSDDLLQLRKVELPFIDRFTCERWYASRGRPIQLIDRQFCAGLYEGGKDACRVSGHCIPLVFNF